MRKLLLLCALLLFTNMVNAKKNNPDESGNGSHFKISLPAAGQLKQRLENAVLDNSDYDVVDSLTVKGKFGGEDLAYLVKSEGILTELTFLDLSQVELVYDDKEYLSSSSSSGFYWATINHYLFSSENRDESRNYLSGGKTVTEKTYYRNDFASAFNGNKKLTDCRLPKSLKGIGEDIFNGCEALEKVTLPNNPTYVGNNAFRETVLKTIELPTSVEKVGDYALEWAPIENIDLSHVRSFGKGCLKGTSIKNIQLADGMESIPEEMFNCCWELTSVVIPSSVKSICNKAFEECNNLETVSIPGSVESIGDEVFRSCDNLKTVNIAEGVKKIGSELFKDCWAFENFSLPSTIEEVGHHIFPEDWLHNTTTPLPFENGIWYIGKVAYALEMEPWTSDIKNGLTSLDFKEGTISIADEFTRNATGSSDMVYGLDQIKTISLPSTLRRIGRSSLSGLSVSSITLPDALEYIGDGAFGNSKKLRRITIPENVKYLGTKAFADCGIMRVYYNAIEADVYAWVNGSGNIGYDGDIFRECPLVRVYIGEGVKKIPATLFYGCSSLARVQMASTVESIGEEAFAGCTSLEHIDLPSSLKEIANSALPIGNLKSVACYMKEPIDFGANDEGLFAQVVDDKGTTVYDAWHYWQEGQKLVADGEDYYYGQWYLQTPLGTAIRFYRIDTNGNISWGYWDGSDDYVKEVLNDNEVVRLWREAMDRGEEYYYGTSYIQTEEVGDVECYYRIDADENVQFGYWKDGKFKINGNIDPYYCYLGKEVLEDDEVVRLWQEAMDKGEEYYNGILSDNAGILIVNLYYRIDADKNVYFGHWKDGEFINNNEEYRGIIWTDKVRKTMDEHIPLLQVPKGQLSAYQSHPLWSLLFDKIEALDGASDVEPVSQTTTVTVSESVKEDADLSNTMMGNIFVTLDVEDSGDGYNAEEGCIVINSTTSEEGLAAATAEDAEDLTVKNLYNGLIMEVPGGKGKIVIDCQTLGQNVVFVKIGDVAPQKIDTDGRQQLSVPYDVEDNTHVYIYAAKASVGGSSNVRRAAYANDDAVKIYGLTFQVDKINAEPITLTAKSYTRKYGEANPAFEYTSEGAALVGAPEISCEATATSPVGTYPIVIKKGSVKNLNDSYVNGTLTISKAPLTITAQDYVIKQGDELPTFEVTYDGFKNSETKTALTKQPVITCTAKSSDVAGTYEILISGAESGNYEISYVKGTLTIEEKDEPGPTYMAGDANNDGSVNVFDVTAMVNYILGSPSGTFVFDAADVNNDETVNVFDVTKVVNIILGVDTAAKRRATMTEEDRGAMSAVADGNEMYLVVDDAAQYVAMQFDVVMPEGTAVGNVELNSNADHVLSYRQIETGRYRVIAYSLQNANFKSTEQALVSMKQAAGANIENAVFVTSDGRCVNMIVEEEATGIDAVSTGNEQKGIYDMSGQYMGTDVNALPKGFYIRNRQKIYIK